MDIKSKCNLITNRMKYYCGNMELIEWSIMNYSTVVVFILKAPPATRWWPQISSWSQYNPHHKKTLSSHLQPTQSGAGSDCDLGGGITFCFDVLLTLDQEKPMGPLRKLKCCPGEGHTFTDKILARFFGGHLWKLKEETLWTLWLKAQSNRNRDLEPSSSV